MHWKSKLTGGCLTLALAGTLGTAATFAQGTATTTAQQQQQTERRMEKRHNKHDREGMGLLRAISKLDLTDAQRQQVRASAERYAASTKTQREQLRQLREQSQDTTAGADREARAKQLRAELRASMTQMRAEVLPVLTAEQRAKLEQMEQEMRSKHDERRAQRRRNNTDNDNQ